MKAKYLLFIALCGVLQTYSQEISGVIFDSSTNQPIEGASVYFDNTTVGTISNEQGLFSVKKPAAVSSPLVISFLGYKEQVFSDYSADRKLSVRLVEDINALNEVFLVNSDSWAREKKMKYFKAHFLGTTSNGLSCKILNEDVISLRFLETENKLVASASAPLVIINENLNYQIRYDLQDFELEFDYYEEVDQYFPSSFYYAGTLFYQSLSENRRIIKRRLKTYNGSVLHFMRSVIDGKLVDNNFELIYNGAVVSPENVVFVTDTEDESVFKVRLLTPLVVTYDKDWEKKSAINSDKTYFFLDENGNHSPENSLMFSGYFSSRRIGDALPLDYQPTTD
ncbi:carboxypeptidase-like regulatory domain-containing protein [Bizionia myxarmorum]|uniref:Carboxypeptidase-like regulatory domain-containing protein n=1 Tax=Bizionia myxarmorum TaxID=291186 RepID=A0A5D0RBV7_9FLAO|nr:carboxypeptidase-like regulatory domain-containing protein [Bizionia myxarmorum]TYB78529.1 carboxypeptidase-like regulatory domain-containing protein [Bizionia myxarmorum]